MTKELDLWKGEFGNNYIERNPVLDDNIQARMQYWTSQLGSAICTPMYTPTTILEVGAGQGANLQALGNIYRMHDKKCYLSAIEPNEEARKKLEKVEGVSIRDGDAFNIGTITYTQDLVFTMGVLIHIHPDNLLDAMKEIYRVSKKHILCAEYFSPELREVKYHGEKALWTQDFGSIWLDNFKLRSVAHSFHWKRMTGMDNITTWLFEKVN